MKIQVNETTSPVMKGDSSPLLEFALSFLILLSATFLDTFFFAMDLFPSGEILELTYSENMAFSFSTGTLFFSLLAGGVTLFLTYLLLFLLKPSGLSPRIGKHGKNLPPFLILSLFGLLAHVVLTIVLTGFSLPGLVVTPAVGFVCSLYEILLYKLYMEQRTYSNALFWEIFRFAIVGLVAAVFDFLTCYLVQFFAFAGNQAVYVTILATACGFLIGVVINYLMSTFMVYKNAKTKTSRTGKGMLTFFLLSAVGLLIGIGIQAFLYDYLFLVVGILYLSYPVDFVIRTLIVMVYNYITRKVFIYK